MPQSRQLAAIMFTDIVGYTALMGNDEQKAFSILNQNRQLQKPVIEKFGGRWIKELGDGVMATIREIYHRWILLLITRSSMQRRRLLSGLKRLLQKRTLS